MRRWHPRPAEARAVAAGAAAGAAASGASDFGSSHLRRFHFGCSLPLAFGSLRFGRFCRGSLPRPGFDFFGRLGLRLRLGGGLFVSRFVVALSAFSARTSREACSLRLPLWAAAQLRCRCLRVDLCRLGLGFRYRLPNFPHSLARHSRAFEQLSGVPLAKSFPAFVSFSLRL